MPERLAPDSESNLPYRRTIRFESSLVAWHELVLTESAPAWSDVYRAESPRLLIPGSHWIEAEQCGRRFFCDALTPLALTPEVSYRTRQPHRGQRSVVLVFGGDAGDVLGPSCRPRLGTAALWRLACCRAALEQGATDRLGLEETLLALLAESGADSAPAGDHSGAAPHARGRIAVRAVGGIVDRAVERARERLACDPATQDSLHEIARAVGASPFHLARRFKRTNGIGLHAYRTRLRMALALARLGEGEDDLTGLALDLGYSSHSHFTATFRSHCGATPSHARGRLARSARFR